jgi:hypothetical protein
LPQGLKYKGNIYILRYNKKDKWYPKVVIYDSLTGDILQKFYKKAPWSLRQSELWFDVLADSASDDDWIKKKYVESLYMPDNNCFGKLLLGIVIVRWVIADIDLCEG